MSRGEITGDARHGYMVKYTHNIPYLVTTAGPYLTRWGASRALARIQAKDNRETAQQLGDDALRGTIMKYVPRANRHACHPPLNLDGLYGEGTIWACNECLTLWIVQGWDFIRDTTPIRQDNTPT